MSPTSAPVADNSVRQQLDELDSLLQRMLELPLNQLEETSSSPPEPPPSRRTVETRAAAAFPSPPMPAPATTAWRPPAMTLLADPGTGPQPKSDENWDPGWWINLNPQQGSSVLGPRSPAAEPIRPPTETTQSAPAQPIWRAETVTYVPPAQGTSGPRQEIKQPVDSTNGMALPPEARIRHDSNTVLRPTIRPVEREHISPMLWPMSLMTTVFDAFTGAFGPPGLWLRSPMGRMMVGASGIMMLGGSVVWGVLDWIGWTW